MGISTTTLLVEYVGNKVKVKIICPIHGVFEQLPTDHVKSGCFKCGDKRKTTGEFIKEATSVHGDKYDYSQTNYIQYKKPVDIICKIHGLFKQTPANHLRGSGCYECSLKQAGNKKRKFHEGDIKPCPKCHKELPLTTEFYFRNNKVANGFSSYCKECEGKRSKKQREDNPEVYQASIKKSRTKRKEIIYQNYRDRRETDLAFKIRCDLSSRINYAVKNAETCKCASTVELMGCTPVEFVEHLKSLFTEGMTMENYGYHGWHIDHIRPCASFDLTDTAQQRECFGYLNSQPMWSYDNFKKSSYYNGEMYKKNLQPSSEVLL